MSFAARLLQVCSNFAAKVPHNYREFVVICRVFAAKLPHVCRNFAASWPCCCSKFAASLPMFGANLSP
jgi:hypothetical protein